MIPRILTGVALTGMLAAAGCGGGSGAGSPALSAAPAIGGAVPAIGGAPAAKARGSFVASFTIPYSAARASAASSRSPQYLSPGTTGLTVLVGNGGASHVPRSARGGTWTLGTTQVSAPTAGAGQVVLSSGSATTAVAGDTLTIPGITLGANGTGGLDVFTITGVDTGTQHTLTGTWAAVGFGTSPSGTVSLIETSAGTTAQTAVIGSTTAALALS